MSVPPAKPLSYSGEVAVPFINKTFPPTASFNKFSVPTLWVDTSAMEAYLLVSLDLGTAEWLKIGTVLGNIEGIDVDTSTPPGTDPVVPDSSFNITITGGQVASGTTANVIQTNSLAANTFTVQVQRAASSASTNSDLNGVCHFNSSHFSVDSNGFVQLLGGTQAIDQFTPDTGTSPVVPSITGNVNLVGQSTPSVSGIQITGGTNALNIAMFSPFEGDFAFTQSNAASATNRKIVVANEDITNAASNSQLIASVGGTSSGDAHSLYSIASSHAWADGPDTSDSGSLKTTYSAASSVTPSSGTTFRKMTTGGVRTLPLQAAFKVFLSTSATNITGDGTIYSFGTTGGGAVTTDFDQNSNITTPGGVTTFTAPVTGKYFFDAALNASTLDAAMTIGQAQFVSSAGHLLPFEVVNSGSARDSNNVFTFKGAAFFALTAGDTVTLQLFINGSTATAGLNGNASGLVSPSWFSGFLVV